VPSVAPLAPSAATGSSVPNDSIATARPGAADAILAPRLTRLELHGFKSFASRTVFAFERGITAVVGPNGSGKSNISDAVRWVLGEQSHGALRSKRTEDVIFAGGQGRAPAGMAEVAVTFDNADGWLPIDFAEVTVTRRAHRSGENHYLINGRRVRLKDVSQLTASLGQSHLVVGQGLVDAALSQRAEERRGLFEHAADLTGLRLKAAEAERSLTETEANSARLADLLGELEPRLKTLERAARQAREWRGVHERLRTLQQSYYGRLLHDAIDTVATEAAAADEEARMAAAGQVAVERLTGADIAARAAVEDARAALAQHDARRQTTIDQARRIAHERDLAAEREAALGRRREDMDDTRAGLDEQVATVAADLGRSEIDLRALEAEVAASRDAANGLQAAGETARRLRLDLERGAASLGAESTDAERRTADLRRRRDLLQHRQETDASERARASQLAAEIAAGVEVLRAELTAAEAAALDDDAALGALDARLGELDVAADRAAAETRAAEDEVADAAHRLGQATTRLEVLQRLHESGAGLHAGVRDTLAAARSGQLQGVRGTVGELLEVPSTYDTAIEVALGGHLQDIIVERWADAEAAIAHLKRGNAGRATFQPLDTVRARAGARPTPTDILGRLGVHGVAAELVRAAPELWGVVEALLGRMLIVDDLPAARTTLPALPGGWSAVTLAGEIARSGGSVTGGAAVRESGVLGRERELRESPVEIERLERAHAETLAARDATAATARQLAAERHQTQTERAGRIATISERERQRQRLTSWIDVREKEREAAEQQASGRGDAAAAVARELATLSTETADLQRVLTETQTALAATRTELDEATAGAAAVERDLTIEQRRLAALEERLRAERRREVGLRAQERALADELALRAERAAALDGERAALVAQRQRLSQEAVRLEQVRDAVLAERPPLEFAVKRAQGETQRVARTLEGAREALRERERGRGAAELRVERARGELATIRQRIADDLELADPDEVLDARVADATEPPGDQTGEGGTGSIAAPSPAPNIVPIDREHLSMESAERQIATLKERLRRVGYVGEDAVAEYEREAERQGFLRTQLDDVQGAAATLRELLGDLHGTMRTRFDATFSRVAEAFTETFTTLFGGGSARLVLTGGAGGATDENGTSAPGIDIVAQPPGKRLQSLALLSGGERALTAAALLIAILRVNPSPFCMLDEVDAALDEANVVRFREQLRELAAETQVIVITHNRGTIEIADTLYGVSMGDDGVSQVLSLRLAETAAD